MGDGEDEVLRTNWKLYCHLLQAITAYIQSKMLQLNKQCRVEKDVIKEIFECSETALSSIRCDSLKSKLTEVQFTSILTSFVEGMLSLALELETQPDFKGAGFPALSVLLQRLMTRALQHPMVHNIILNKVSVCSRHFQNYYFWLCETS